MVVDLLGRQGEEEGGASAGGAELELAALLAHQLRGGAQAQAGAGNGGSPVAALEDPAAIGPAQFGAVVGSS